MYELLIHTEREAELAAFERLRRQRPLPPPASPGPRAWLAARLAALAVRMDRYTAERALVVRDA
jgi:hypothetical protein